MTEFTDWTDLFPERIETERLTLRRLSRENVDLPSFYEVCAHDDAIEEVTEYLTWNPHETPKATFDFVTEAEEAWEAGEDATYVVVPKESEDGGGKLAGGAGVGVDWDRRTATLGVWLRRRYWGRGYSGERAAALMELAFEHLDLDVVAVECQAGNENSRRAIEKYVDAHGGRYEGLLRNRGLKDGRPVDQHRFSVTDEEYADATGGD